MSKFLEVNKKNLGNNVIFFEALLNAAVSTSKRGDGVLVSFSGDSLPEGAEKFGIILPNGGMIIPETKKEDVSILKRENRKILQKIEALGEPKPEGLHDLINEGFMDNLEKKEAVASHLISERSRLEEVRLLAKAAGEFLTPLTAKGGKSLVLNSWGWGGLPLERSYGFEVAGLYYFWTKGDIERFTKICRQKIEKEKEEKIEIKRKVIEKIRACGFVNEVLIEEREDEGWCKMGQRRPHQGGSSLPVYTVYKKMYRIEKEEKLYSLEEIRPMVRKAREKGPVYFKNEIGKKIKSPLK